jgi:2-aminoadipate transaminase
MLESLCNCMTEDVSWTKPEGGLFLFVTLPDFLDAEQLLYKAIEKKVAFVIGNVFYCNGEGKNTMRLNFSFVNDEQNLKGIERLASVIKDEISIMKKKHNEKALYV